MKNEILIYQSAELTERIEVRMEDESIWLNRNQIALLFGRDIKTIGKHIKNALNEELNGSSVVANFATTASDGKVYRIEHFNLEMVISIGYRVKSNRGTQFRIWANQVLKDYLLKGYAANNRMNRLEDQFETLKDKVQQIDLKKANEQYGNFEWKAFDKSHDRFLIIDQNEVYHLGASLKDLGKKWFAFSKLDKLSMESMLNSIMEVI
jgi:hypothetical protein